MTPGGLPEWIVIGLVVLLVFGAKKLPEMARSLGRAKTEFRKGLDEGEAEERDRALKTEQTRQAAEVTKAETAE